MEALPGFQTAARRRTWCRRMRSRLTRVSTVYASAGLWGVVAVVLSRSEIQSSDRAYHLNRTLRCPVCRSRSIDESPSPVAQAMRLEVAHQVNIGRSSQQIIDHFRSRYGDWVILYS